MNGRSSSGAAGFTLADVVVTIAIGLVLTAIAVPVGTRMMDSTQLLNGTRLVEREFQTARMWAVSRNRPMRVRLNCPGPGQVRIVEITGVTTTDTATNRCDESAFPYPGPADSDPATPAHDGAVKQLGQGVSVDGPDLQFSPRGTVDVVVGGVSQPIRTPVTVTVVRDSDQSLLKVNRLGRITIE